jgi:hypothetical protein
MGRKRLPSPEGSSYNGGNFAAAVRSERSRQVEVGHETYRNGGLIGFGVVPYLVAIPSILILLLEGYFVIALPAVAMFGLWIYGSRISELGLAASMMVWCGLLLAWLDNTPYLPLHYGLFGNLFIMGALAIAVQWLVILVGGRDD